MGLTIKRDTNLEKLFDKFATLPDKKDNTKDKNKKDNQNNRQKQD